MSKVAVASACAALLLMGCSVVVDANRVQCNTDADCTARGPAFASSSCVASLCTASSKWSCLSDPPAVSNAAGPFNVTMHVADLISHAPLPGVQAELCRKLDVACAEPVSTVMSDAAGTINLQVEAAFSGYVWLQSDTIVPTLYFFNPTIDHDTDIPSLSMSTPSARGALLGQLGADTSRGDILLDAWDCTGVTASSVSFSITPESSDVISYYLSSDLPTRGPGPTDSTGYGGFVNLNAGTVTVSATDAITQEHISDLTLVVRPGTATWARMVPNGG